uniref:Uncharacterized protein n=1 Tax=Grammatophora oceanica TaxID=210454 RepID=A0A7S1UUZ4_9STRA
MQQARKVDDSLKTDLEISFDEREGGTKTYDSCEDDECCLLDSRCHLDQQNRPWYVPVVVVQDNRRFVLAFPPDHRTCPRMSCTPQQRGSPCSLVSTAASFRNVSASP